MKVKYYLAKRVIIFINKSYGTSWYFMCICGLYKHKSKRKVKLLSKWTCTDF